MRARLQADLDAKRGPVCRFASWNSSWQTLFGRAVTLSSPLYAFQGSSSMRCMQRTTLPQLNFFEVLNRCLQGGIQSNHCRATATCARCDSLATLVVPLFVCVYGVSATLSHSKVNNFPVTVTAGTWGWSATLCFATLSGRQRKTLGLSGTSSWSVYRVRTFIR